MTRLRGRCPKGQRLRFACPHGHWRTTTVIGAVRLDGTTAAMAIEGATDTEVFRAYVQEVLVPTLRVGDLVIMDNLAPHKNEQTIALIRQVGADVLFLPPYSPDLNPIEMAFSKLKAHLRAACARTFDALWQAVGSICDLYDPDECWNFFKAAGYTSH